MGQMCGKCSDALWCCDSAVSGVCEGVCGVVGGEKM